MGTRQVTGMRRVLRPWLMIVLLSTFTGYSADAASETQDEALARLDGIVERLRAVREDTRTTGTFLSALEGSVSYYACARTWLLGTLAGGLSIDFHAHYSQEGYFVVPGPHGPQPSYSFDNGLNLKGTAKVDFTPIRGGVDVYSGFENWNCWALEPLFDAPRPYDIVDHETPYDDGADLGGAQAKQQSGAQSGSGTDSPDLGEGAQLAIQGINSLVNALKSAGLDPTDPEVVSSMLSVDPSEAIGEFGKLAAPEHAGNLAALALGAPGQLLEFLGNTPVSLGLDTLATSISNLDDQQALSIINPCAVVPGVQGVCDGVVDTAEMIVDTMLVLSDFQALYDGSANALSPAVKEFTNTFRKVWRQHFKPVWTAWLTVTAGGVNVRNILENLDLPLHNASLGYFEQLGEYIQDALDSITELQTIMNNISEVLNTTYRWERSETFRILYHATRCYGLVEIRIGEVLQMPNGDVDTGDTNVEFYCY